MSALKLILIIIGSAFVLVVVAIIIMFLYAAMKIAAQEVIDRRHTDSMDDPEDANAKE